MNASLSQVQGVEQSPGSTDLEAAYRDSHVGEVLDELDRDLVGLVPVKSRIRDIAALLLIDRLRRRAWCNALPARPPPGARA